MECPLCKVELLMTARQGVEIDYCPRCRGVWLDRGELDKLIELSVNIRPVPALPEAYYPPYSPATHDPTAPEDDSTRIHKQNEHQEETRERRPKYRKDRDDDDWDDDDDDRDDDDRERRRDKRKKSRKHRDRKQESWLGKLFDFDLDLDFD